MISKQPSPQLIVKEQSVLSTPDRGPAPAGDARNMYNRRREQVRRAQRNHRNRKKMYVKSMEDEVLRLQDEWAAVLQEIARASEENLVLKDILKCQPFQLSSPASTQRVSSGRATSFSEPIRERRQYVETASVVPQGHFRNSVDNFKPSASESMTTSSPSSDSTGSVTVNPSKFEDSESSGFFSTTSTSHQNPPSSEDSHSFSVFMTRSLSHQTQGECLQPQSELAIGMEGSAFSVSSTMSCRHPKIPDTEHYVDLGLCLAPKDSVHSFKQIYQSPDQDGHCGAEPRAYHDISGVSPPGNALYNSDAAIDQSFLLRTPPTFTMHGPAATGQPSTLLYNSDGSINQSFLLEADPTSAGHSYATTNLLNRQLEVTDWWPETV